MSIRLLYLLFAASTFVSSFLLFQVQPLVGKHIVPWYGGSAMVWVTAMLFFMVALAMGYLYALVVSRIALRLGAMVHIGLLIGVLCLVYWHSRLWPSAITPPVTVLESIATTPTLTVFLLLTLMIGAPFVVLSATSTLMQYWYAKLAEREPFTLYSISNIGSLCGLLSYPFVFEPWLATNAQGSLWTYGFVIAAALLLLVCGLVYTRASSMIHVPQPVDLRHGVPLRIFLAWMLVAAIPVFALLGGTSFMSSDIAPVPFVWVGQLVLYLVSFIYSFQPRFKIPRVLNPVLVLLVGSVCIALLAATEVHVFIMVAMIHVLIFVVAHWCHEHLYRTRPAVVALPWFYVALSFGGIVGSVAYSIASIWIFTVPVELLVLIIGTSLVAGYSILVSARLFARSWYRIVARGCIGILCGAVLVGAYHYGVQFKEGLLAEERNFFGYKAVTEHERGSYTVRSLRHGLTNHGNQPLIEGSLAVVPGTYYSRTSGVGRVITQLEAKSSMRVLVAGLGVGSVAAYCRPQDTFTFFEIDDEVVRLAEEHFTLLASCPQARVQVGDARLLATAERETMTEPYDVLVIDTYADDMVPMHMLTREAFLVYQDLIAADGYIAVHISSRYLDLAPVLTAIANDADLVALEYFDDVPEYDYDSESQWVILSAKNNLSWRRLGGAPTYLNQLESGPLWTDTYSALLPIVQF